MFKETHTFTRLIEIVFLLPSWF